MRIPNNAPLSLLVLLPAANIVLMIVLAPMGESLKNSGTDVGIFQLIVAGSLENAEPIMAGWRKAGATEIARQSIWPVFAFFVGLSAAAGWWRSAIRGRERHRGNWLAYPLLACTPLDALENAGMLRMLDFGADLNSVYVTTICAWLKWLLVGLAFAFVLFRLIAVFVVNSFLLPTKR